jgi:hypothetical protein
MLSGGGIVSYVFSVLHFLFLNVFSNENLAFSHFSILTRHFLLYMTVSVSFPHNHEREKQMMPT